MNAKAHDRMQAAEIMYLLENGWRRLPNTTPDGPVLWTGLSDKYAHGVTQGHAVNAQKQYDHSTPKHPPTRRLVVEVSDRGVTHHEQMTRADAHKFLDEYPLGCEYKEHLLRAELEAKAQRDRAEDLAKELLERNKQLSDMEVLLEKSRAFNKNREVDIAATITKTIASHTEVCLERNKLRNRNRDLVAELEKHGSSRNELLTQLGESKKSEATLRDQLREQLKIVAELQAQLIERATPEFMQHHMTLTRQVASLQSECHDLRQRNMTLAGDMSVVRNSLNQANSERREAQEDLRRMTEDKKAAATLLRQALDHLDRLQYSAGTKAEQ